MAEEVTPYLFFLLEDRFGVCCNPSLANDFELLLSFFREDDDFCAVGLSPALCIVVDATVQAVSSSLYNILEFGPNNLNKPRVRSLERTRNS